MYALLANYFSIMKTLQNYLYFSLCLTFFIPIASCVASVSSLHQYLPCPPESIVIFSLSFSANYLNYFFILNDRLSSLFYVGTLSKEKFNRKWLIFLNNKIVFFVIFHNLYHKTLALDKIFS